VTLLRSLGALTLLACACDSRLLAVVPDDPGDLAMSGSDLPFLADLAIPSKPCHLIANGTPTDTLHWDDPQSGWRNDGLQVVAGTRHVVHYGNVQLRFGGWSDPAAHTREYDVSTWPPTAVAADTELSFSMHAPSHMYQPDNGNIGAIWFSDNDGGGPSGVRFRSIVPGSWALGPDIFLAENSQLMSAPVQRGDQFAIIHKPYNWTNPTVLYPLVSLFDRDGKRGPAVELTGVTGYSDQVTLGNTGSDLYAVTINYTCVGDMACTQTLEVLRVKGTSTVSLEKTTSIAVPISGASASNPLLVSDHAQHHFLTWWETGDARTILYALPIHADATRAGPPEVWLSTPYQATTSQAFPSIGPLGVVYPVALALPPPDGGNWYLGEVHLLQRQLVENAPVLDTVITSDTGLSSYGVASVQLDNPRTLILGYSEYSATPTTKGAYGRLARFTCSED